METINNRRITYLVARQFSIDLCKKNMDKLFIFGDNELRSGMGGQAIIREQVNSMGICTKKAPGMSDMDFFTDDEYIKNCKIIDEDIDNIERYMEENEYKTLILPKFGLGTGLSQMPQRCPKTFLYLCSQLLERWNYNNIEFLASPKF